MSTTRAPERIRLPNENAGGKAREISRGIVAIYKDYLGRGPTRAQTVISGDVVMCVLEESLTKAELTLVEGERSPAVRGIRREFQEAMRADLKALVSRVTGREVRCLMSDHCPEPDYAVEVVVLEPEAGADPGPDDLEPSAPSASSSSS